MIKRQIFRVILSPFKVVFSPVNAFKEIAEKPDVKGIVVILALLLLAAGSAYCAQSSKLFLSSPPKQAVSPQLLTDSDAYVYVTAFGNFTFQSAQPYTMNYAFIDNTPLIEQSFFWVNATESVTPLTPVVTEANNTLYQTTLKLYHSTTEVGNLTFTIRFYSDESPKISTLLTKTAQWDLGNFTINWFIRSPCTYLANGTTAIDIASQDTLSLLETNVDRAELGTTDSPNNWALSLLIDWSDYGNATVYGGHYTPITDSGPWLAVVFNENDGEVNAATTGLTYSSLLTTNLFGSILLQGAIETAFVFFLNWMVYVAILLLIMRVFGERAVSWRPFFVVVGYTFSIMIVQWAASAILIATLPEVHLQVTSWPPTGRDEATLARNLKETWGPTLALQGLTYLTFPLINIFDVWMTVLIAVAVRAFTGTTWRKAAMISTTTFIIKFFLRITLGL